MLIDYVDFHGILWANIKKRSHCSPSVIHKMLHEDSNVMMSTVNDYLDAIGAILVTESGDDLEFSPEQKLDTFLKYHDNFHITSK